MWTNVLNMDNSPLFLGYNEKAVGMNMGSAYRNVKTVRYADKLACRAR